ncbi:hypothetical protein [Prosthecobacter sp.]|uniref:hypothetical protein n=1 Tax=Prosthecobacter sp. TaxID=1965333 RepID=UPI003784E35B
MITKALEKPTGTLLGRITGKATPDDSPFSPAEPADTVPLPPDPPPLKRGLDRQLKARSEREERHLPVHLAQALGLGAFASEVLRLTARFDREPTTARAEDLRHALDDLIAHHQLPSA